MPGKSAGSVRDLSLPQFDVVCFSHLRWDFVYQRPQHLLSRCARAHRVFFIEEPIFCDSEPRLDLHDRAGVTVAVPRLRQSEPSEIDRQLELLLSRLLVTHAVRSYVSWYYTPMALGFTGNLAPVAIVYDCMDELSLFKGAPTLLKEREAELLRCADLVFTGGRSLYEAKSTQHPSVHLFPSSIDREHFGRARSGLPEPKDQLRIPRPRLGYSGVLDERLDLSLLRDIASARLEWQLVMLGPVVKIEPADLPSAANIHYLGSKPYSQLPAYIGGWDVALLPFALNDSTRYISPTKTPEYLAAGKPVVSTPVRDVVRSYGEGGLVKIAASCDEFIRAIQESLGKSADGWLARVDEQLANDSWDLTWKRMCNLISECFLNQQRLPHSAEAHSV